MRIQNFRLNYYIRKGISIAIYSLRGLYANLDFRKGGNKPDVRYFIPLTGKGQAIVNPIYLLLVHAIRQYLLDSNTLKDVLS